jgi:hypothetical protein
MLSAEADSMRPARKPSHDPAEQPDELPRPKTTPSRSKPRRSRQAAKARPSLADSDINTGPNLDEQVRAALAAAGLLAPIPDWDDLPTDPTEIRAMIEADEAWILETFTEPIGLAEAVEQDREERG